MAVGVVEVDATAAVPGVDPPGLLMPRTRPVRQLLRLDPPEDLVELLLADQERIVLRDDRVPGLQVVQGHVVAGLHTHERTEGLRGRQAEQVGQEPCAGDLVRGGDDRVVELNGHRFARFHSSYCRIPEVRSSTKVEVNAHRCRNQPAHRSSGWPMAGSGTRRHTVWSKSAETIMRRSRRRRSGAGPPTFSRRGPLGRFVVSRPTCSSLT